MSQALQEQGRLGGQEAQPRSGCWGEAQPLSLPALSRWLHAHCRPCPGLSREGAADPDPVGWFVSNRLAWGGSLITGGRG